MTAYETPEERRQRAGIVEVPVPGKSAKKLNGGSHPQPDAFPKKAESTPPVSPDISETGPARSNFEHSVQIAQWPRPEVPRSMGARPGTAAMPSPSGSGSASRRHSAGSRLVAGQEKTKFRGRDRVGWAFTFVAAAYNLVRLPKLLALPG